MPAVNLAAMSPLGEAFTPTGSRLRSGALHKHSRDGEPIDGPSPTRPAFLRYRTSPAVLPSASALQIYLQESGEASPKQTEPRSPEQSEDGDAVYRAVLRNIGAIQMTRQIRRISQASRVSLDSQSGDDVPIAPRQQRNRSGRFESIVSWKTGTGSWAAISAVDEDALQPIGLSGGPAVENGMDLYVVGLNDRGGRNRFMSTDSQISRHRGQGGIWGAEGSGAGVASRRRSETSQRSLNAVRNHQGAPAGL